MKYKLTISTLLLVALFLTLAATAMASTTRYVNGVHGSDTNNCKSPTTACKTIGHAIALASSGDSITVAAATYRENLTIGGISLNVIGSGASTTIIDGGQAGSVVTIPNAAAHVTLSKLTMQNGKTPSFRSGFFYFSVGGGIKNYGTLTLTNSTVSKNWAPIPCVFFIRQCLILRGTASGGGIANSGTLIISNSIISGNHAGSFCNETPCSAFGGGIENDGTLMIRNSTLTGNSAGTACSTSMNCAVGVGGAFNTSGTVTLNNSTVEGNSAYRCSGVCSGTGGAINNGGTWR